MKIELEDSDIARIAEAVAKKLGGTAPASTKAADKPETAAEKKKREAAEAAKAAGAKGPTREEVLATVKELGDSKGRDVVKGLISKYAESFGKVADSDLANLAADLAALAAGSTEPADEY